MTKHSSRGGGGGGTTPLRSVQRVASRFASSVRTTNKKRLVGADVPENKALSPSSLCPKSPKKMSPRSAAKKRKANSRRERQLTTPRRKSPRRSAPVLGSMIRNSALRGSAKKRRVASTPGKTTTGGGVGPERKVLFREEDESVHVDASNDADGSKDDAPAPSISATQNVRVVARLRPLSQKERDENARSVVRAVESESCLLVDDRRFEFDDVFGPERTQTEVYKRTVGDLVRANVFKGFNVTVLAYGQTGSGKTHTMGTEGGGESDANDAPSETDGVIPRAVRDLFRRDESSSHTLSSVTMSYLEIHNEEIRDLLVDEPPPDGGLSVRDDGRGAVNVPGLSRVVVDSPAAVSGYMSAAAARRATARTNMNAASSRSHAICALEATTRHKEEEEEVTARLTLVDLAGSERIKRTGAEGARMKEGININKGLFVLGQVVSALSEAGREGRRGDAHVPYRDSKLTRLLQDSLGGNSKTVMVACASPADSNAEESTNTLRYAERTRSIRNAAVRNVVDRGLSAAEAAALRRENQMLKLQLLQARTANRVAVPMPMPDETTSSISSAPSSNEKGTRAEPTPSSSVVDVEKLELVTRLRAHAASLQAKTEQLEERVESARRDVLRASVRGDEWRTKYERLAERCPDEAKEEESTSNDGDTLREMREEIEQLKDRLESARVDAAVARETAAAVVAARGDLTATEEVALLRGEQEEEEEQTEDGPKDESDDQRGEEDNVEERQKLTDDLVAVSDDIERKEAVAAQMRREREAMDSLKEHFEGAIRALEREVHVLSTEREGLLLKVKQRQRHPAAKDNSVADDRARERVASLEERIKVLQRKAAEHAKSLRLRERAERKCERLQQDIAESKRRRAELQRRLKEESAERRAENRAARTHAARVLRDKRRLADELQKVQEKAARQAAVLRRKATEAVSRQKRAAEQQRKRHNAAVARAASRGAVDHALSAQKRDDLVKWIERELEAARALRETKEQIDEQNALLDDVAAKQERLETESATNDEDEKERSSALRLLANEIKTREGIVRQLEKNVAAIHQTSADHSHNSDASHSTHAGPFVDSSTYGALTRAELRAVLVDAFERLVEARRETDRARRDRQRDVRRAVDDAVERERRQAEDDADKLRLRHSETIMSLLESTQGAVESRLLLRVLEDSEAGGVEPDVKGAVDDALRCYMKGCDEIGASVKEELRQVKTHQDGVRQMVDRVAVDLIGRNEVNATKKKKRTRREELELEEEEHRFVFQDDEDDLESADDSDWDPDGASPRRRKRRRRAPRDGDASLLEDDAASTSSSSRATKENPFEGVLGRTTSSTSSPRGDSSPMRTDAAFDSMKVSQLKELLREKGLKVSGKKSDLLKRLRDSAPSDRSSRPSHVGATTTEGAKRKRATRREDAAIDEDDDDDDKENVVPAAEESDGSSSERRTKRAPLQPTNFNELVNRSNDSSDGVRKPLRRKSLRGIQRRKDLANSLQAALKETEKLL